MFNWIIIQYYLLMFVIYLSKCMVFKLTKQTCTFKCYFKHHMKLALPIMKGTEHPNVFRCDLETNI